MPLSICKAEGGLWLSGRFGSVPGVWMVESLFQAIAMAKRLYVGNLSYSVTRNDLQELFEQYGRVRSAQVLIDRETGRSRGFGFVEMEDDAEADAAIESPRRQRSRRPPADRQRGPAPRAADGGGGGYGGGGGGGGGYGGGGGGYGGGGGGGYGERRRLLTSPGRMSRLESVTAVAARDGGRCPLRLQGLPP